ncbi:MAG TPA: DUF2382 domain-containing protein [Candidatus Saccharimonadales bacterium]|nr:DUF2382 domain-containing protein [Candidatus Saccharimonadales bacterium]
MNSQSDNKNTFGIELAGRNTSQDVANINNYDNNELIQSEELVSRIPLYSENFRVTKKEETGNLTIEKKWITSKKKIEIPIQYEEVYVNGKELDSFDENEIIEIFSRIRSKLSDVFINENKDLENKNTKNTNESKIEIINTRHETKRGMGNIISQKSVPISDPSKGTSREQHKIELWGEELIVNKRMVKLGELVISKYEVRENRKVDVELRREKLTLKFPGNHKEEIS